MPSGGSMNRAVEVMRKSGRMSVLNSFSSGDKARAYLMRQASDHVDLNWRDYE